MVGLAPPFSTPPDVCIFCHLLLRGSPTADYLAITDRAQSNYLPQHCEGSSFVIIVEVAPIVPGHILILPKTHLYATALLPGPQRSVFALLRKAAGCFMAAHFSTSSYISYEHGSALPGESLPRRIKCAPTEHAHVHIMPNYIGDSTLVRLQHRARTDGYYGTMIGGFNTSVELAALRAPAATCHTIVQGDESGERGILYTPPQGALPSQYFRRILAQIIYEFDEREREIRADWRDEIIFATSRVVSDVVKTARALRKLSPLLVNLSNDDSTSVQPTW